MNYHRFKQKLVIPFIVAPALLGGSLVSAQDAYVDTSKITDAANTAQSVFEQAAESQARINRLSDEADELISEYRDQAKIVDGLVVYNAGMRRTIDQQERTIAQYDESIAEAAELQRQIAPLMERMMVALEQFVELDLPFQIEQRTQRLEQIRDTFDDSSVNVAEKFRLVLQAYQIENNYGRAMAHYEDTLELGGIPRDVDILRVGRIALLYQTKDQTQTGAWDQESRQWMPLGDEYRRPVSQGIRMAQQLATTEILELPISAPELAQ